MKRLILPQQLDINAFYDSGVATCNLKRPLYDQLQLLINSVDWVPDPEKTYNAVPRFVAENRKESLVDTSVDTQEWDYDRNGTIECFPEPFRELLSQIIRTHLIEWSHAYNFKIVFMDMWDGSEDCPWHWDGTDDSDMIMLCYANNYAHWEPTWGGQLLVGKRHLSNKGLFSDFKDIKNQQCIQPQRRTLALVNNRNPQLVHKPEPLTGTYERKVFTAGIRLVPRKSLSDSTEILFGTPDPE